MIPMVDLKVQYEALREEILEQITDVLESCRYILGPKVEELEKSIAAYHGVKEAVGVASGTDALNLSLKTLGIGKDDEVITTPFTFFATVEAIIYQGAKTGIRRYRPRHIKHRPRKDRGEDNRSNKGNNAGAYVWSARGYGEDRGDCLKV